jgi:hypothetical protein
MSAPKPLTAEEIAQARFDLEDERTNRMWWCNFYAERLLAAADRLALVERELAEADAVIAWWFDSPWDEPPPDEIQRAAIEARERHAARQKKEQP